MSGTARIFTSFDITANTVAVVGSGGKSTFLAQAARALEARGERVVLATSTHFMAPAGMPLYLGDSLDELEAALASEGVVSIGGASEDVRARLGSRPLLSAADAARTGKLSPSPLPLAAAARLADRVLVEADGSRCLPLKAHGSHEPVVPEGAGQVVAVVGASGFMRPVGEVVHRAGLACGRLGTTENEVATPELVARLMVEELRLGIMRATEVVVNQVEDEREHELATRFARELARLGVAVPVFVGSLRAGTLARLS